MTFAVSPPDSRMAQLEEYAANLKSEKERVEEELENATMKICGFESQMKLVSFFTNTCGRGTVTDITEKLECILSYMK